MRVGFSLHDAAGRIRVAEACKDVGLSPRLWAAVLDARKRHAGAGNRRRLFASFDALFDGADDGPAIADPAVVASPVDAASHDTDRVTLTRLVLKNWKVFQNADFVFPPYDPERPVVLIGGKNGYGKTSFLEGLLHGLFGRDASVDLERVLSPGSTPKIQTYRETLERALHRPARERGDGIMSVRSEWQTAEGELVVERRWYFDRDGALVEDDEGLNLWTGSDREVLAVPPGEDASVFYQEEIARRLMPPSLAAFVLFDGEQVKRFAQRDFAEQVRVAVETVLGLTVWRDVIGDLRDYARDRSKGALRNDEGDRASDENLVSLGLAEQTVLESIERLAAAAEPLRARRDEVLEQLGALSGRTYATMQDLLERRQIVVSDKGRLRHDLASAASTHLPLVLAGANLRARLVNSLEADRDSDSVPALWGENSALERLVSGVKLELNSDSQDSLVEAALRRTWALLAAEVAAPDLLRHSYVPAATRDAALGRLMLPQANASETVRELARKMDSLAEEHDALDRAIAERETQDQAVVFLRNELDAVTSELDDLNAQRRVLDQALGRIQSDLVDLREVVESRLVARISDAQLVARRRAALDTVRGGEALIDALKPSCFEAVGEAVTSAYCALAHKGLVERIVIDPEGGVILVDGRGVDVRAIEASAGESQVFAMALMAAVAQLAGRQLPSIIDTPLGRLDPDHRRRVLRFFTSRNVQTILLSQPDEVNQHYLDMIAHRVSGQFHLDHTLLSGGPGGSVPQAGYFPEMAA